MPAWYNQTMPTSYERFIFDSYHFDTEARRIELHYSVDDAFHFTETFTLAPHTPLTHARDADVDRAVFALHIAAGISYFKAFCPPQIEVRSGKLSVAQADFWDEFYTRGLGEFFYQNKIDYHGLIHFPVSNDAPRPLPFIVPPEPKRALVPFGGGKDSQVTAELLRERGLDITLFRMQPHRFITELAEVNHLPLLEVTRTLDPQLYELNKQGALNGHIPITGIVTFLTMVVALLNGFDSVFFSNERSSDYGNVEYLGLEVNHQWSKSNEAERMLRDYIEAYITHKSQYLNLLRPLSDLHIAKLFTRKPTYFAHVTSCNRNWLWQQLDENPNQGRWCGECDKCAFTFAMFAAFLPLERVVDIFKKNLYDDATLLPRYRQLWGAETFKPFECVGTPEETKAALYLATRQEDYATTIVGQEFVTQMLPHIHSPERLVIEALTPDYTNVPPYVRQIIKEELARDHPAT